MAAFKKTIAESDGVLIATPEYNHGIPGVLKNAPDWASRPVFESCFKHKPVSIISSSVAFTGGVRAQYQLRETLISMHAHLVMGPEVVVGGIHTNLADDFYTDEKGLTFILKSLGRLPTFWINFTQVFTCVATVTRFEFLVIGELYAIKLTHSVGDCSLSSI